MKSFGEAVRWRRKALGLSQEELAQSIRLRHRPVTQGYISRLEAGILDPRLSLVYSIARALRLRPWHLVAGITENPDFWSKYLSLPPQGKRDIQRHIDYLLERRP